MELELAVRPVPCLPFCPEDHTDNPELDLPDAVKIIGNSAGPRAVRDGA